MKTSQAKAVDVFIAAYPAPLQKLMKQMRETIRKAAPRAEEKIGYGIPTFTLNGNLVHFSAYDKHIGFYPGASGIDAFSKEISKYKFAKGSVQFPVDKPLPLALVTKIVKFRVKENLEKVQVKTKAKSQTKSKLKKAQSQTKSKSKLKTKKKT